MMNKNKFEKKLNRDCKLDKYMSMITVLVLILAYILMFKLKNNFTALLVFCSVNLFLIWLNAYLVTRRQKDMYAILNDDIEMVKFNYKYKEAGKK